MAQLIELQKNFMKSNEVGQTILKFQREIFRRKIEKNYSELVKLLIQCHDYIDGCSQGGGQIQLNDEDKQRDIEQYFSDAQKNIFETCRESVTDFNILPKFAYEVRKQDKTPVKKYTEIFVLDHLSNKMLKDIIANNFWVPQRNNMNTDMKFSCRVGKKS